MYEANTGLGAESPWEATAQAAAKDLVEYCNSGVNGGFACFAGYSNQPYFSGCDPAVQGQTCIAQMPSDIPTPAYGNPISIWMSVLVTNQGVSTMEQVLMGLGANSVDCNNYFVQATLIPPPVADQGCNCHAPAPTNGPDPVDSAIGNEFLEENDVDPVGWRGRLAFKRYYNSLNTSAGDIGPGWRYSFSRYLQIQTITLNTSTVSALYSTQAAACTSGWSQIKR